MLIYVNQTWENKLLKNKHKYSKYKYNYKYSRKTKVKTFQDESAIKEIHAQSQQLTLHPVSIVRPEQLI